MARTEGETAASRVGVLLLSAFGLGLAPIVPGTVTSLATAAVLWAIGINGGLGFGVACAALAVAASRITLRFAGEVTGPEGRGDPGWVVSDEVAGQAVACLGALAWCDSGPHVAVAFLLFRVFDMLKPPPVRTLEGLHGARGILYDDIAAGVLAAIGTLLVGWSGLLA